MKSQRDWHSFKIKEIGRVVTGRTPSTKVESYFGDDFPFITPSDMDGRKTITETARGLSQEGARALSSSMVPARSISVSCIGWQMGKVIITGTACFTNQQLNSIIPNDRVDPDFLYYRLSTMREKLKNLASVGTRTPILIKSTFEELEIDLPSLPTQRCIASILSAYDDLIENNTRRIKILEEMARLIYREWFIEFRAPGVRLRKATPEEQKVTGKDVFPVGWEIRKLGAVVELAYGKGLKADHRVPGQVPVFGSAGIVGYHNESLVKGPGIIVGRKGNVGSVFWSDEDFYPIDTVFFVRTEINLHYVYYNLQGQNFLNNDAAVPGLSRNQAYLNPFVVPTDETLNAFTAIMESLFSQIRNLQTKNAKLRQTRDLLLPKLVSGEIDVSSHK